MFKRIPQKSKRITTIKYPSNHVKRCQRRKLNKIPDIIDT